MDPSMATTSSTTPPVRSNTWATLSPWEQVRLSLKVWWTTPSLFRWTITVLILLAMWIMFWLLTNITWLLALPPLAIFSVVMYYMYFKAWVVSNPLPEGLSEEEKLRREIATALRVLFELLASVVAG